jgi:hypothetical protein
MQSTDEQFLKKRFINKPHHDELTNSLKTSFKYAGCIINLKKKERN